jgi:hypothetical protein
MLLHSKGQVHQLAATFNRENGGITGLQRIQRPAEFRDFLREAIHG